MMVCTFGSAFEATQIYAMPANEIQRLFNTLRPLKKIAPMTYTTYNLRKMLVASASIIVLMVIYIRMNSKEKHEYERTTGQIVSLTNQRPGYRLNEKNRYLVLSGYP